MIPPRIRSSPDAQSSRDRYSGAEIDRTDPLTCRRLKMSTEQNKSIVRRWIEEGWNKGDLAVIDQVYAPDYVQHEPAPETVNSSAALKQYVGAYLTAFPDLHFSIEDLLAEGDKVVWRFK